MRVTVKTQAEFDAAVARGDEVEVRAGSLTARGHAVVYAYDDAGVYAHDNAVVSAYDDAVVVALERAAVSAYDNAVVVAHDNAKVWAHDNAKAWAYGNAVVRRPLPIDPEWRKLYERELERAKEAA